MNIPDCIDLTDGNTFTITVSITSGAEAITIDVTSNDWLLGGVIPYYLEGIPGTFADGDVQTVTVHLEADVSHLAGEYADVLTFTFTPCTAAE